MGVSIMRCGQVRIINYLGDKTMKTVCFYVLLGSVLLATGCSSGKGESFFRAGYPVGKLNRIAVAEVYGPLNGELARNQVSDFFVGQLLKKGYTPVERAQVQAVFDEQEFQSSDLTSPENVAKAGRILNVQAILVVNVPTFEEELSMTAKLIDVEDAGIIWMASGTGSSGKSAATFLGAAAGATAGAILAGGDTGDKVAGGIIGGVLGGVAGQALSPQQSEAVHEVVKRMFDELPPKYSQPRTTATE